MIIIPSRKHKELLSYTLCVDSNVVLTIATNKDIYSTININIDTIININIESTINKCTDSTITYINMHSKVYKSKIMCYR